MELFKSEKTKKGLYDVCQLYKENNITVKYVHDS